MKAAMPPPWSVGALPCVAPARRPEVLQVLRAIAVAPGRGGGGPLTVTAEDVTGVTVTVRVCGALGRARAASRCTGAQGDGPPHRD